MCGETEIILGHVWKDRYGGKGKERLMLYGMIIKSYENTHSIPLVLKDKFLNVQI